MFKLKVNAMNCMSCVHNIKDALEEHDPKVKITPHLAQKQISIETNLEDKEVRKIVEAAGYPVDELVEDQL